MEELNINNDAIAYANAGDASDANSNSNSNADTNVVDRPELTTRQKIVVGSFVSSLVLEIVLNKRGYLYTPSYLLRTTSTTLLDGFSATGSQIILGSKLIAEYISIEDVAIAIHNLLSPIGYLLLSPYNMFVGMGETILADRVTALIGLGTTLTLSTILFLIAERRSIETFRPSNVLSAVYKRSWQFYEFVGRIVADISSIYRVLQLDRVVEDAIKIAEPATKLLVAPVRSISGYFKEINIKSFTTARVIMAGTFTIGVFFAYGNMLTERT